MQISQLHWHDLRCLSSNTIAMLVFLSSYKFASCLLIVRHYCLLLLVFLPFFPLLLCFFCLGGCYLGYLHGNHPGPPWGPGCPW